MSEAAAQAIPIDGQANTGAARSHGLALVRDLVELTKPRISAMTAIVAGGAMILAPGHISVVKGVIALFAMVLAVSGAGALNMVLEKDVDRLMDRTKNRPLATGRVDVAWGVVVGGLLSALALPLLYASAGAVCCALTAFSLFTYVGVYTPMKRTSPWSLVVGAVPGAMPALMGSSAVSQTLDTVGVALFVTVFVWQLPHFIAISIYRQRDYDAAGHQVFPTRWGLEWSKAIIVATTAVLVAWGVALWPLGLGSPMFGFVALTVGGWFLAIAMKGYATATESSAWARRVFFGSLVYQTVLFAALALDYIVNRWFFA